MKKIVDGKHVKRGVEAHLLTLEALYTLYQKAFFCTYQDIHALLSIRAEAIDQACTSATNEKVKEAHAAMLEEMSSVNLVEHMISFEAENETHPLFVVMCNYMKMVMTMNLFIRAVRTGNWELHLLSLGLFTKHFFALDMLNYARMMPLYLAEMESLKTTESALYAEFLNGNWVVNKNPDVPFCAVGADHALEHINRSLKVSGGIVGITLNPAALRKFFMVAPELARLCEEANVMAGLSSLPQAHHHGLSNAVLKRHEQRLDELTATIEGFTNPFTDEASKLYNIATKTVVPENVKQDLINEPDIGNTFAESFISERIKSGKVNLWSPMKKQQLKTWRTAGKKVKVAAGDKIVELQEDRSLFARMLLISKSRREVNLREIVAKYELSVVPRSMFAADGTMLHCSAKSTLMTVLEQLPAKEEVDNATSSYDNHTGNDYSCSSS